jgi:glycosyltransferase involved in cell wall biosynthesis
MKKIAVVLPCYNEEESLPHTIKALSEIKKKITGYNLDFIFINDGSSDETQAELRNAAEKYNYIYYRQFSKNRGHQTALRAGIDAAVDYDAVIMMDSDLQHPPELLPKMLKAWEDGAKIVQMVREDDKQIGLIKYTIRHGYYRFINTISDLKIEYGASDFRLIDKEVAKEVAESPETDLFLRGYFTWMPVRREVIIYKPNQRVAGSSKYNLRKLLHLANKSILQFSEKPLKMAVTLGVLMAVVSFLYGLFLIIQHATGTHNVSGWTSLMVVMLFCFGLNLIILGIIGSYLAHSITIQKKRPEYIIASEKLRR